LNTGTYFLLNTKMNNKELKSKIRDLLIIRDDDGSYHLFGTYTITSNNGYYTVTYEDEVQNIHIFSSLKHAVTWCVFDKNNKYKEVKRIIDLDSTLSSLDVSIAQHKKMVKDVSKDVADRYIYMAKLNEEKLKKQAALNELNTYINISKHLQTKKFAENQAK
jgi:hypothetical protein